MQKRPHGLLSLIPRIILLVSVVALPTFTSVFAFKPKAEFGHVGIVRDAVRTITRTATTGETLRFSMRAIEQIRDSTAGVDELTGRGELFTPAAHCDDELLPACSQRIINIKNGIISTLMGGTTRDGEEARRQVGRALHTLQDFYSHSNWVNSPGPGNATLNSALGRATVPALPLSSATCVDDLSDGTLTGFGLTNITSGYFSFLPGGEPPANKCSHGKFFGAGIHKDAPGRPFHAQARARAVDGTRDLINQILDAPGIAGNDDAIRAFMDIRGTLGFVIDDTGSMGPEIAGVRSSVVQVVNAVAGTDDRPDNYLLVLFGDPTIGAPFKTTDATTFLGRINTISVGGGGDCPELSQGGLLSAIGAANGGSKLYFYSDASAKDSSLAGNVAAAASRKKITINYVLTGSCSPVDPAYIRVAQETGGQVFFIPSSQTSLIFGLIEPSLAGNLQPILLANDSLSSSTESYEAPIDSSVTSATFSVSLDSVGAVRLFRPSGVEATAADPDVTLTQLSTGRIITVDGPAVGSWNLEVSGSGDLSVSVLGNSDLELNSFSFVEVRGRLEHQGYFPINGQPVIGEALPALARLLGPFQTAQFELVSTTGELLQVLDMDLGGGDENSAADDFVGTVDLPSERFRVNVRGVDENGFAYLRAFPPTFLSQSVRVAAGDDFVELTPGTTTQVEFEVTNLGTVETFRLTAADDLRYVIGVTPSLVTLGTDESATVVVSLFVPDGEPEALDTLSVVAQSTSDVDLNNNALLVLAVVDEVDTDGDGVLDDDDDCPMSDLSATVVIDGCDSGVPNALLQAGCTISDLIAEIAAGATHHGELVSGVSHLTNELKSAGILTGGQKGAIQSCAAQSNLP